MTFIAHLPHGEDLLIAALSGDDQVVILQLAQRFGVEDMLGTVKGQLASLLYYFGRRPIGAMLTWP